MDNLPEVWRPIPGWEGLYEVSSEGRVRSLARTIRHVHGRTQNYPATLRKLCWNGRYFHVSLTDRRRRKTQLVHQAVALAFVGPRPSPRYQVNHKDGDPTNNRASNLEWVTARDNSRHAVATGLTTPTKGERSGSAKLTAGDVSEIRRLKGRARTSDLARRFDVSPSTVCDIQQRRSWRHIP